MGFRRGAMTWFPWKTLSVLLLVSTAAIINADLQRHGGKLGSSNVGQFLQDVGQYDRVMAVSQAMVENYKFGHAWVNTNVPVYLGKAQPYIEVAQEKTGEAFMKLKSVSQSALDKLEEAAPGAQKHINNLVTTGCNSISSKFRRGAMTWFPWK